MPPTFTLINQLQPQWRGSSSSSPSSSLTPREIMLARTTPIIQAVSYILVRGRIFALERRVRTLYLALYPSRRCAHAGGGFSQNFLKGPSRAGTGSSVNRLLSFLSLSRALSLPSRRQSVRNTGSVVTLSCTHTERLWLALSLCTAVRHCFRAWRVLPYRREGDGRRGETENSHPWLSILSLSLSRSLVRSFSMGCRLCGRTLSLF